MTLPPPPSPFLEVRVDEANELAGITALCAGYEQHSWREKQLAQHLTKWLPEFALKHSELIALGPGNAVELLAKAAKSIYSSEKYKKRGEFGEILLHAAIRQRFATIPAISKYFYKDSPNETIKGFDAVHVVDHENSLELWLGEVKFYADIKRAISDVLKEIYNHLNRDYLRSEFAAITNKIDDSTPHAVRLKRLIHPDTSLDQVFDRVCIPALLTYNSPTIKAFSEVSADFKEAFTKEILKHHQEFLRRLKKHTIPKPIRIHLFLLPIKEKESLTRNMDAELKKAQAIQ